MSRTNDWFCKFANPFASEFNGFVGALMAKSLSLVESERLHELSITRALASGRRRSTVLMFRHIRHINYFKHERNTRGHTEEPQDIPNILSFTALHTYQRPNKTDPSPRVTSFTFTKILPHLSSFQEGASNPILSLLTDLLYPVTSATKQPVPVVLGAVRNFPDDSN